MIPYYRGHLLAELRRFPGWVEPEGIGLTDETVVYVRQDLSVVLHPVQDDESVLWDADTPRWRTFCESELRFEVPAELRADAG
ncbi:hypothetical protein ACLQ22_29575 [Micromonospora sp. DT178]|uniref:Uncharacterized protein n=1 Tax=Micromonospora reichwaldensis TaxID=3075516 RepID=A0ABU2WTC6_9ACTN|nr:hypothetical protein [Micromonospora sp. DSM 115977]MDT0529152.1 hypothetical protein [Micromonospora sp. DSM 115977]